MTGAKIGIGENSFKMTKYSSDRLGNYLATGTFFLTEKIEGLAACFRDGVHVDSFSTVEEMNSKVNYYLTHDDEREGIAREGQKLVLDCFDCKPLVKNILHIINTGQSLYDWDDLYTT
jgi:spore maturation protein CgeB